MDHGQEKQPRNELHALTRREPVATPSNERGGVLSTRMPCVDIALQERDSRCLATFFSLSYEIYDTCIHIIGVFVVLTLIHI